MRGLENHIYALTQDEVQITSEKYNCESDSERIQKYNETGDPLYLTDDLIDSMEIQSDVHYQRIQKFQETGDVKYLTPKLAIDLTVPTDVMSKVEGAPDEYCYYATPVTSEECNDHMSSFLREFSLGEKLPLSQLRLKAIFSADTGFYTQEELTSFIKEIILQSKALDTDVFTLFAFATPGSLSGEIINSGDSVYARLYKIVFDLAKDPEFTESKENEILLNEYSSIVSQDPQMIGAKALWQIAKDNMWRKDIPQHYKTELMGWMAYALDWMKTPEYQSELKKQLDFKNLENYAESAHLLEALKRFWSMSYEHNNNGGSPDFFIDTLKDLELDTGSNYLLTLRAKEILSIMEDNHEFYTETNDSLVFSLSKDYQAIIKPGGNIALLSEDKVDILDDAINSYEENEMKLVPPDWFTQSVQDDNPHQFEWAPKNRRAGIYTEIQNLFDVSLTNVVGSDSSGNWNQKELVFDYEYLVSRPVRELIQNEFKFIFSDLTLKEQFYFLNYLKMTTVGEADTMKHFTSLYGVNGMRTFLSLEAQGEDFGDKIVAFGQHEEVAKHIFSYYGELLDSADRAENLVRDKQGGDISAEDEVQQVRDNILRRAQKDLVDAVETDDISSLEVRLDTYNAKAKEYVALLQETTKGENIEIIKGGALSNDDKTQMRALLRANYHTAYPDKKDAEFKKAVEGSLGKHFDDPNTTFRVLYDGAKIVSFNRFDAITDEQTGRQVTYFGSFNAAAPYSGVGGEMLKRTIAEQLQSGIPMMAHCDPTQKITQKYIESGFVATKKYHLAGKESFEIWQSDESSDLISSKQMSPEALLALINNETDTLVVRPQGEDEAYPELENGYALTRIVAHEGEIYVVFEVLPEELTEQFVEVDEIPPEVEEKRAA